MEEVGHFFDTPAEDVRGHLLYDLVDHDCAVGVPYAGLDVCWIVLLPEDTLGGLDGVGATEIVLLNLPVERRHARRGRGCSGHL